MDTNRRLASLSRDVQRRAKARAIRALTRFTDETCTMEDASKKHGVSRVTGFRMIKDLELWESKASHAAQAHEVNSYLPDYDPLKWVLCSGAMIKAYMDGEISSGILNDEHDRESLDVGIEPIDDLLA